MTDPATTPSVATFDDQGRIASDIACTRCGYNLRTLRPDTSCPECGTSVEHSLHGDLLRFANPEWVARLAKGMSWMAHGSRWLVWCVTLLIVVAIVLLAGFVLTSLVTLPAGLRSLDTLWGFAIFAIVLLWTIGAGCGCIAILVGQWWLTTEDPAAPDQQRSWRNRIARAALPAALFLAAMFGTINQWYPASGLPLRIGLRTAAIVAACIWVGGLAACIRNLALRIPDPATVKDSWSVPGRIFLTTAGYVAAWVASTQVPPGQLQQILSGLSGLAVLGILSSLYPAVLLLEHSRTQLRRAAELAKATAPQPESGRTAR